MSKVLNDTSVEEVSLPDLAASLAEMIVGQWDEKESGKRPPPQGWTEGAAVLRAAGHRDASENFQAVMARAATCFRRHAKAVGLEAPDDPGKHDRNAGQFHAEQQGVAEDAAWTMAGNMPMPDARPSEWVAALAAQPGSYRSVAPSTVTLPPLDDGARHESFPSAKLVGRRIAAHLAIVGDLSLVSDEELGAWLSHPDESVRLRIALSIKTASARSGPVLLKVAPSLVASAIATGVKWSAPLEEMLSRSWDAANTPFAEWVEALRKHRLKLVREVTDLSPFLRHERMLMNLVTSIAQENAHLTRADIQSLTRDRPLALINAAKNSHTPTDVLVDAVVAHLEAVASSAGVEDLLTDAAFAALSALAERPEGIPADPRLLSLLSTRISKGMSSTTVAILLEVPGMEAHPIIAERIKRERSPEVLTALARKAMPRDFGRYLGRLLTATARMHSELGPFAAAAEAARCHEIVEGVLASATHEQLAGVKPKVWGQAFQHPTAEVRLAAQMAMGGMAARDREYAENLVAEGQVEASIPSPDELARAESGAFHEAGEHGPKSMQSLIRSRTRQ